MGTQRKELKCLFSPDSRQIKQKPMKRCRPVFIPLLFWFPLFISAQDSRPVPNHVPSFIFTQHQPTSKDYYLTVPFKAGISITDTTGKYPKPLMLLDANGYLVWYKPVFTQNILNFKYLPEYDQYSWINYVNQHDIRYMIMDKHFQVLDSFTTTNGIRPDLHEFQVTKNQEYVLAGVYDTIMDLSNYQFNGQFGSSQTSVIGFAIQKFNAAHELLFEWKSLDYIHPTEAYDQYGYSADHFDYCHGNAIWEDTDGDYLVSFRNLNAVYKISSTSGEVVWILGGKSSTFSFTNDHGFSAQHDAVRLPNGNLSLFDNANMADPPKISRAVEYMLDTVNWTATNVWEYKHNPGFLSIAMGNHQTTEDRRHLINYGYNFRPDPSFVTTDDDGNLQTEFLFQDSFMSYRSFLFDIPFDQSKRPQINCEPGASFVTLSALNGYDHYEWSTGENTQSIQVNQTGVYQVWVNYGIGMIGSNPVFINNLEAGCDSSGTQSPPATGHNIIAYFDLLGRKLDQPIKGLPYVVLFDNGQSKLQIQLP